MGVFDEFRKKKRTGKWKCDSCLSYNNNSSTVCGSCEIDRPAGEWQNTVLEKNSADVKEKSTDPKKTTKNDLYELLNQDLNKLYPDHEYDLNAMFSPQMSDEKVLSKNTYYYFISGEGCSGALGLTDDVVEAEIPKVVFKSKSPPRATCGGITYGVLLDEEKNDQVLYTWGCPDEGALAREKENDGREWVPKQVEFFEEEGIELDQIFFGLTFSLFLTKEGRLYGCGLFRNGDGRKIGFTEDATLQQVPLEIKFPFRRRSRKIVKVACGSNHFIAVDSTGYLWEMGCVRFGQRSSERLSTRKSYLHPRKVFKPPQEVKALACGENVNYVLCIDGRVMSWGNNNHLQTGHGKDASLSGHQYISRPRYISDLSDVVQISAGRYHCLALTKNGEVWSWGRNYEGVVLGYHTAEGHMTESESKMASKKFRKENLPSLPKIVPFHLDVESIECGEYHNFLKTKEGIYGFGVGTQFRLATGTEDNVRKPQLIFSQTQTMGFRLHSIVCGSASSLFVFERENMTLEEVVTKKDEMNSGSASKRKFMAGSSKRKKFSFGTKKKKVNEESDGVTVSEPKEKKVVAGFRGKKKRFAFKRK